MWNGIENFSTHNLLETLIKGVKKILFCVNIINGFESDPSHFISDLGQVVHTLICLAPCLIP